MATDWIVVSPLANRLEGRHFDGDELRRAFDGGLGGRRLDALYHFATGCKTCWRNAKSLLGPWRPPRLPPACADPAAESLADLIEHLCGEPASGWLFPQHRHAIDHLGDPLGFARVFLEETGRLVADNPPGGSVKGSRSLKLAEEALSLISVPILRGHDERTFHDLRTMALALLAECHLAVRQELEAKNFLRQAAETLRAGSGDVEAQVRLKEAQAELSRWRGEEYLALSYLDEAVDLLRDSPVRGRLALTSTRKAAILLQLRRYHEAMELLEDILTQAPIDELPRLHLEIVHRLAVARVAGGDFRRVLADLVGKNVESLYSHAEVPQVLKVQKCWILGVTRLRTRDPEQAVALLEEALEGYLSLGLWEGAANTLFSLGEAHLVTGRSDRYSKLQNRLGEIPFTEPVRKAALARYRALERLLPKDHAKLLDDLEEPGQGGLVN